VWQSTAYRRSRLRNWIDRKGWDPRKNREGTMADMAVTGGNERRRTEGRGGEKDRV